MDIEINCRQVKTLEVMRINGETNRRIRLVDIKTKANSWEVDGYLIAAAPELLEALIELVQSYDKCSIDHNGLCQEHFLQEANDCTFKKANLAIAKALGQ